LKKYKKIYFDHFNYAEGDFVPSEISGKVAVDIHHIDCVGMGGGDREKYDVIENLMALTREEHIKYGDKKQYKEWLKEIHLNFMKKEKYES